jgi:hypothetical protein
MANLSSAFHGVLGNTGNGRVIPDLRIHGRRWRDSFGNTYHRTYIFSGRELIGETPITYGYDNQYIETGLEWLKANGYWVPPYRSINATREDVRRKRDL